MIKNFIAKLLRTPQFKQKKVNGYYYDYNGRERILYDDNQ